MRVSVVLEQRFIHTADGATYDNGPATYTHWRRYLNVFEEVQVVGRSQLVSEVPAGYVRVDGPAVSVLHVPYYQGPAGFLRRLPKVARTLQHGIEREEAVIVRLAGVLEHFAAELCRWRGQPYAVEVINDPYDGYGPDGTQHPLRPIFRAILTGLTRRQCRQASAVQYVTRSALQKRYPARTGTPQYGVSDVHLPPAAFVAQPRRYSDTAKKAVLVGLLEQRHKAADIAIAALAQLRGEGHDLRLRIVGDGPLRPTLEAQAQGLGIADAVEFVGQRSTPSAVRQDLAECDLFLIPSRTEGLPRVLAEALAQGLPAIGSAVGGIPELIDTRWLVKPGDVGSLAQKWRDLALSPAQLEETSAQNLETAQSYADETLNALRNAFLQAVRRAASENKATY